MKYVYVKDDEGFVCKKPESKIVVNETVISEAEYKELSGENYYEEHFSHGGSRFGAGRKPKDKEALRLQMRVSEKEKEFLLYARARRIDYARLMK